MIIILIRWRSWGWLLTNNSCNPNHDNHTYTVEYLFDIIFLNIINNPQLNLKSNIMDVKMYLLRIKYWVNHLLKMEYKKEINTFINLLYLISSNILLIYFRNIFFIIFTNTYLYKTMILMKVIRYIIKIKM